MAYIRNFMVLSCEADGYGFKGKKPIGRCVLEMKGSEGKLTCWAQDLKPETLYNTWVLFEDGNRYAGYPVGPFNVDAKGKAEVRYSVGMINERFTIADCTAVIIMAAKASRPTGVLCGYRNDILAWRNSFFDASEAKKSERIPVKPEPEIEVSPLSKEELTALLPVEEKPVEIKTEAPVKEKSKPEKYETVFEEPTVEEPAVEKPTIEEPAVEEPAAKEPKTIEEPEIMPDIIMEKPIKKPIKKPTRKTREIKKDNADKLADEIATHIAAISETAADKNNAPEVPEPVAPTPKKKENKPVADPFSSETTKAIYSLFERNDPATPFSVQNRDAKWVRITPDDSVPLPENAKGLMHEYFISQSFEWYKHLLLGLIDDVKRPQYIIGVPDMFNPESRLQARRLGFMQFKCSDSPPEDAGDNGEFGYWLMFINL